MEYNKDNNTIILHIDEYSRLVSELDCLNEKINLIKENLLNLNATSVKIELSNTEYNFDKEIRRMRENNIITYKQYRFLKYILENNYFSDLDVCKSTSISYSSICQWKKKDSDFTKMYQQILLSKTI